MEDVRIGRKAQGRIVSLPIAATPTLILGPSDDRFCLVLGQPISGTITWGTDPNMAAGAGITLSTNSGPVVLTIHDVGDLITLAWFGVHSVGGVVCSVIESIFHEK